MTRIIGARDFTDGICRDVYEDDHGRQWVLDGDGEPIYGVWMLPADEPQRLPKTRFIQHAKFMA